MFQHWGLSPPAQKITSHPSVWTRGWWFWSSGNQNLVDKQTMKLADVQKILNGCDSNIFLYGIYNYYNLLSLQLYRHVSHYIIALFRKWFSFAKLNPCMGFPPEIFPGVETTSRPVFLLPHLEAMETLPSLAISALRSVATVACCSSVGVYARRQGHGFFGRWKPGISRS